MTYVEKFRKILKDLDVLSKEQQTYKEEIFEVLAREDATATIESVREKAM